MKNSPLVKADGGEATVVVQAPGVVSRIGESFTWARRIHKGQHYLRLAFQSGQTNSVFSSLAPKGRWAKLPL